MASNKNWQCQICGRRNADTAECLGCGHLPPPPRPAPPSASLRLSPIWFEGQGQRLLSINEILPEYGFGQPASYAQSSPGPRPFSQTSPSSATTAPSQGYAPNWDERDRPGESSQPQQPIRPPSPPRMGIPQSQQRLDGNRESLATPMAPGQANPNRWVPPRGRPRGALRRTRSASPRGPPQSSASSSRRERYRERSGSPAISRPPPPFPKTPENRPRRSPPPDAPPDAPPVTPEDRTCRSQSPSPSPRTSSAPRQSQLPRDRRQSPSRSPPRPLEQRQEPVNKSLGGDYALAVEKDHQQYKRLANRYTETRKACDECEKKHRQCDFRWAPDQCDHCFKRGLRCLIKGRPVQPAGPTSGPPRREDRGHRRRDDDDERDEDRRGQGGRHFNRVDQGGKELFVS